MSAFPSRRIAPLSKIAVALKQALVDIGAATTAALDNIATAKADALARIQGELSTQLENLRNTFNSGIDSTNEDVQEVELKLNNAIARIQDLETKSQVAGFIIGVPVPWSTDVLPTFEGFEFASLKEDVAFDASDPKYAQLAAIYPDGVIPNMAGKAIFGAGADDKILSYEEGQIKAHTHNGVVSDADLGNKSTSSNSHHHKEGAGVHSDNLNLYRYGVERAPSSRGWVLVGGENVNRISRTSTDSHKHTVALGKHGHGLDIKPTGVEKNTVDNRKFNYIVRLK